MKQLILALALLLAAQSHTYAHDQWANGKTVPSWVKIFCCGPNDVHQYEYKQVHFSPNGLKLPDHPDTIPYQRVLPSEDEYIWAFWDRTPDGIYTSIYCIFVPPGRV